MLSLSQTEIDVLKARVKGYYSPHLASEAEMVASARLDSLAGAGGLTELYNQYLRGLAIAAQG